MNSNIPLIYTLADRLPTNIASALNALPPDKRQRFTKLSSLFKSTSIHDEDIDYFLAFIDLKSDEERIEYNDELRRKVFFTPLENPESLWKPLPEELFSKSSSMASNFFGWRKPTINIGVFTDEQEVKDYRSYDLLIQMREVSDAQFFMNYLLIVSGVLNSSGLVLSDLEGKISLLKPLNVDPCDLIRKINCAVKDKILYSAPNNLNHKIGDNPNDCVVVNEDLEAKASFEVGEISALLAPHSVLDVDYINSKVTGDYRFRSAKTKDAALEIYKSLASDIRISNKLESNKTLVGGKETYIITRR